MKSIITYFCTPLIILISFSNVIAQNSMVGDGFGGRLWYKPTNYTVGSYSAFSLCYANPCDSSTNQLYGWGSNNNGELGNPNINGGTTTPVAIPGMSNLKYYSTGYNMGAIKNDGSGWVWGYGLYSTPTQVITDAYFLDGSISVVSFVKTDGTVWSVGDNSYGNFGNGTTGNFSTTPVQMSNINNAVRVANGWQTTYVLLNNGDIMSVGLNNISGNVLLGTGSQNSHDSLPAKIDSLQNIVDIKAVTYAAAALDSSGDVYVWGTQGYLGNGTMDSSGIPKKIPSLNNIVAISGCADGFWFLALDENKNCYIWPWDTTYMPKLIETDVIDIMAGETFSYIVKSDGSLWCMGLSNGGSIWLNLTDSARYEFTQIDPSQVAGSCAIVASNATSTAACNNLNNGTITVHHNSGLAPYTFTIDTISQSTNVFTGMPAGTYTITITDANSCVTTVTCTVNAAVGGVPTINVNSPNACGGNSVTLTASGANTYTWANSSTLSASSGATVTAHPATTTVYTVTGTATNGCSATATSTVSIIPQPIISVSNDTICAGDSVTLIGTGAGTYLWSPAGSLNNTSNDTVIATPTNSTTYTLNSSYAGCSFSQNLQVLVNPAPSASFSGGTGDTILIGGEIQLINTSQNAGSITWTNCNTDTSHANYYVPVFNTYGTCCIKLVAKQNECKDSAQKCFYVLQPYYINFPNVFSPNGDGKNDQFKVDGVGITNFNCIIYNRWGQMLYEWNDLAGYWDGRTDSGIAPDGTYYYVATYNTPEHNGNTSHGFLSLFSGR